MAKNSYVHGIVILDRSGSMGLLQNDTIGGFNSYIEAQRKVPGEFTVTLVQFDNIYEENYSFRPVDQVVPLNRETYQPRGSTALYDAIGRAFTTEGQRLAAMPESGRPGLVQVTIITDGQENASREYNFAQIKEMIEHQQEKYKWQVNFIGSDLVSVQQAQMLGIPISNTAHSAATRGGTAGTYAAMSSHTTRSRKLSLEVGGAAAQSLGYTQAEIDAMQGKKVDLDVDVDDPDLASVITGTTP